MHSQNKAAFRFGWSVPLVTGTAVLLLGLLAMAGWVFKIAALVQVGGDPAVIQFNSGLGFVLSGAGLLALTMDRVAIARYCGSIVGALGLLTLAEYATGRSLGIDTLLIQPFMIDARFPAGRMAETTALTLTISGTALLAAASPIASRWPTLAVSAPGIGVIALSVFGFTEYLARLVLGEPFGFVKGMAVHTAFGFIFLGAALVSMGLTMQREVQFFPRALAGASGIAARTPLRWMPATGVGRIGAFIISIGLRVTSLYRAAERWNHEFAALFQDDPERDVPGVRGSFPLRYGLAVASIALATWVRLLLDPAVGFQFPFATLFFGVLLTAWYGGFGPALLSVLLGALFSSYFLLLPRGGFSLQGWDQQAGMLLFLGTSLGIALLGGSMHAAQRRAQAGARRIEAQRKALAEENIKQDLLNKELKVSEERFRKVFDVGPLGMIMSTLDNRLTHVNARFCRMLGYSEAELLRLTYPEFTHPGDRSTKTELVGRLLRGEIPILRLENRYLRKDGGIVHGSQTAVVVRDNQGQPQFFLAMVEDITARKQAEEALRVSEDRFRRVVESHPNALVIVDSLGRIKQVNSQAMVCFGYTREELIGQPIEMLMPKRFRAEHPVYVAGFFKDPSTRSMGAGRELCGLRKDGYEIPIEIGLSPIETPEGLLTVASIVDITERKRIVNELEQFAYAVSHDLRQPLRGITGFCRMLVEDYGGKLEPEARRYVKTIVDSAEKMGQLIDDLLKLSRISREEMVLQAVDLSVLCRHVVDELRENDPARQVDVKVEEGLTVQGDPRLLKLLLQNLIGNAWKFTSRTGDAQIAIGRRAQDGTDAFFVADNGAGFNMKYADKLFGAFQRLHKVSEFEGTGVGLATVQRIVNRHGGRIWAEAEEGKGASFYFSW